MLICCAFHLAWLTLVFLFLIHSVQSQLSENDFVFSRPLHGATHMLGSPARSATVFAQDVKTTLQNLGIIGTKHFVKRAALNHCKIASRSNGVDTSSNNVTSSTTTLTPRTSSRTVSTALSSHTTTTTASPFQLIKSYTGNDFFNEWDFNTGSDPTHGVVDYLSRDDAQAAGLAFVNSQGNFVMQVDTTTIVSNLRKSIRITAQESFNGGLLLMDSVHMPTGCGTWPAFWSNGPDWPQNGEIDIVEGVNDYTDNQATVHTRDGCTLPSDFSSQSSFSQVASGQLVGGTNCAALETENQGCGVRLSDATSFGPGFNTNGGGVYAMLWDTAGIAIFFFPRNNIPMDILTGNPNPNQWGLPAAKWPASSCDPFSFFQDHVPIFDTTLCGDWAGNVWDDAGIPGQAQSCAQRTNTSSCEAFVLNNGGSFTEAYWEVSYVQLFQAQ